MKKSLIVAGAAFLLAISGAGLSHAGDRIIHYSPAPVVVYSPHVPIVVPGHLHGRAAWKDCDPVYRHPKRHHRAYAHRYDRGYAPPRFAGSYYQPGFSLSIGAW